LPDYEPRTYRERVSAAGLTGFRVGIGETDLSIQAAHDLTDIATRAVLRARQDIRDEIAARPQFLRSLVPLKPRPAAADIVLSMYRAGERAGTGPMAAVAGAVAEYVGRELLDHSAEVIVENGGDVFLSTGAERTVAVYAGASPLSGKVGIVVPAGAQLGICTSSATVGPSYSAGRTDATMVIAAGTAFADAMASAVGNRVKVPEEIEDALNWAGEVDGVLGVLVIVGAAMGVWGQFPVRGL